MSAWANTFEQQGKDARLVRTNYRLSLWSVVLGGGVCPLVAYLAVRLGGVRLLPITRMFLLFAFPVSVFGSVSLLFSGRTSLRTRYIFSGFAQWTVAMASIILFGLYISIEMRHFDFLTDDRGPYVGLLSIVRNMAVLGVFMAMSRSARRKEVSAFDRVPQCDTRVTRSEEYEGYISDAVLIFLCSAGVGFVGLVWPAVVLCGITMGGWSLDLVGCGFVAPTVPLAVAGWTVIVLYSRGIQLPRTGVATLHAIMLAYSAVALHILLFVMNTTDSEYVNLYGSPGMWLRYVLSRNAFCYASMLLSMCVSAGVTIYLLAARRARSARARR